MGTRITPTYVLEYLAGGMSEDEILKDFPSLTRDHILAVLAYAADANTVTPVTPQRKIAGAFRLMYVAKFPEAVHVLHAFQKKTRKTARRDLVLAKDRYQEVLMRRKSL